mmetsp:Transcript_100793/g.284250  ORF Transcript_100793/g.284250 Transcript_100793/m.284250 type:complete len:405 (-) Transcript_100793:73-1287(-)
MVVFNSKRPAAVGVYASLRIISRPLSGKRFSSTREHAGCSSTPSMLDMSHRATPRKRWPAVIWPWNSSPTTKMLSVSSTLRPPMLAVAAILIRPRRSSIVKDLRMLFASCRAMSGTPSASSMSSRPTDSALAQRPLMRLSGDDASSPLEGAGRAADDCDSSACVSCATCASNRRSVCMTSSIVFSFVASVGLSARSGTSGTARCQVGSRPRCPATSETSSLPACLASLSTQLSKIATLAPGTRSTAEPVEPSMCPWPTTSPPSPSSRLKGRSCQPAPKVRHWPRLSHSARDSTCSARQCERLSSTSRAGATPEAYNRQRARAVARRPRPTAQASPERKSSRFTSNGSVHQGCFSENSRHVNHFGNLVSRLASCSWRSSSISHNVAMETCSNNLCPTWAIRSSSP